MKIQEREGRENNKNQDRDSKNEHGASAMLKDSFAAAHPNTESSSAPYCQ
jgi:hypothetical protein